MKAAALSRDQVGSSIADISIDRLERAFRIRISTPIATILQVRRQVEPLMPRGQEEPDQQAAKSHHPNEQALLEVEEGGIGGFTEVQKFRDVLQHIGLA